MKFPAIILFLLPIATPTDIQAQLLPQATLDTVRTYRSLESALREPDMVYRLDLSKEKLKVVPEELKQFKNLNALDLSNNKLKELPTWIGDFQYLQEFRAAKNKLVDFPIGICELKELERLDLSQNALTGLPACIGRLNQLVSLDLWSNDLAEFPDEMEGMKALRFMDLRVIQMEQPDMDRIQDLLPKAKIYFSQPCNCGM